jgi:hypothetical protein
LYSSRSNPNIVFVTPNRSKSTSNFVEPTDFGPISPVCVPFLSCLAIRHFAYCLPLVRPVEVLVVKGPFLPKSKTSVPGNLIMRYLSLYRYWAWFFSLHSSPFSLGRLFVELSLYPRKDFVEPYGFVLAAAVSGGCF